ncbi:MAG: sugar-binding domain-containing protein [Fulvivirga sp.]
MIKQLLILILIISGCSAQNGPAPNNPREIIDFDFNWRFHLGAVDDAYNSSFDDTNWRLLNLPHDWSIEGNYNSVNATGISGGFLPAGIGWYRKDFQWKSAWEDKKVFIEFDGVYMNSTVWINGNVLGHRPYGYIGFSYDLTPYLQAGRNTIVVKVDHSKAPSGRWYTGSGIYRHVRLVITDPVYVSQWGTYVKAKVKEDKGYLSTETEITNEMGADVPVLLKQLLISGDNKLVASTDTTIILHEGKQKIHQQMKVDKPHLWSLDDPYIYKIVTEIVRDDEIKDRYVTTTGFRTVTISPEEGLKLNGKKVIIKGVSNHHDAGPVGTAVPEDVLYRRLKLLKGMGCNAIRTTHNPFAPEFYAMCDTMGFLVMDEAFDGWEVPKAKYDYGLYFEEWWKKDLTDFIKRDRNHPSVIFWSIGNEVRGYTDETQKKLSDHVRSLDSRPVTQGRGYMGPYLDISGFNGHGENKGYLKKYHEKHPDKVLIGTELTHSYQTRGIYRTKTWYRSRDFIAPWENENTWNKIQNKVHKIEDLTEKEIFTGINKNYQSSYDNSIVRMGVRDYWKVTKDLPYFLGAFRWTGFDYLGESFGWPARTVSFGILDLAGFPTDQYYLYQSLWTNEPMVHLLPHWTHPGNEGVEIPVVVYTNAESAELFLNGKSLGEKMMTADLQLVWKVRYRRGTLKVVAKHQGKPVAEKTITTAGEPANIKINTDRNTITANGKDVVHLEVEITDDMGNLVPFAAEHISFEITGQGKFIGFENGDILDLSNAKAPSRETFNGKCLVLVQSTGEPGSIKINAKSNSLKPKEIILKAVALDVIKD